MFDIVFQKGSSFEDSNKRWRDEIEAAEKDCSPFLIECQEYNGWWGIWMIISDERFLINPNDLVSSIFQDDRYYLFDSPKDEVHAKIHGGVFYANVRKNLHC